MAKHVMEKWEVKRLLVLAIENSFWKYAETHTLTEAQDVVSHVLSDLVLHPENTYDWTVEQHATN